VYTKQNENEKRKKRTTICNKLTKIQAFNLIT